MSCKVTKKSFNNDLKNLILDNNWESLGIKSNLDTSNSKPTTYVDRVEIFVPFDSSNPNKNILFGKLKNLESQINKVYQSGEYGNVVQTQMKSDGGVISIQPTNKLLNALNAQYSNEDSIQRNNFSLEFQHDPTLLKLIYSRETEEGLKKLKATKKIKDISIDNYFSEFSNDIINYIKFLSKDNPNTTISELIDNIYKNEFKNKYFKLFSEPINSELENNLTDFLETYNFDIKISSIKELQKKYNLNILGVFDIINKTITTVSENQRNLLTLPEEVAHAVFELIGSHYKNDKATSELYKLVKDWEGYQVIYNEYSKIYLGTDGKTDWKKVQKEAIGKAIGIAFLEYNKETFEILPLEKRTFIQKIVDYIKNLFLKNKINFDKINNDIKFKNIVNKIAQSVIEKDYNYFDSYKSEGFVETDYIETIKSQNKKDNGKVLNLMRLITKHKGAITGSLSLRKVSVLKRKGQESLHDIDSVFNSEDLFGEKIYNKIHISKFYNTKIYKSLKYLYGNNLQVFSNWYNTSEGYNAIHFYIANPEVHQIIQKNKGLNMLSNIYESLTEEQQDSTILLDIFIENKPLKFIKDSKYNIALTTPEYSYLPKMFIMGRPKDVFDYQNLKYYSNKFDIEDSRNFMFQVDNDLSFSPREEEVKYSFKATENILKNLPKVNQWYKQLGNTDKFWNKLQQDLQIPREQVNLLKESEGNTIEEKLTNFAANYSFVVEINTAKEELQDYEMVDVTGEGDFQPQEFIPDTELIEEEDEDGNIIGVEKVLSEKGKKQIEERENKRKPTQHYSNLTVPGGTNYTENVIRIPGVINVISSDGGYHDNEFNQSRGDMAGWFRSDDAVIGQQGEYEETFDLPFGNDDKYVVIKEGIPTKTRRILEVQSFFQKVRDKENLVRLGNPDYYISYDAEAEGYTIENNIGDRKYYGSFDTVEEAQNKIRSLGFNTHNNFENQFLQLLNKNNNWVTFFVKSIIQDTAKQTITEVQESDVEAKVRELERESLLEIDCKGKLKAEKGLQTNFTKGGKWKLVKDLKGYPTHKEGGVDLTIGKDGVKIKNGNSNFIAKHGLVIPKN